MERAPCRYRAAALAMIAMGWGASELFAGSDAPLQVVRIVVPRAAVYPGDRLLDGLLEDREVRARPNYAATLLTSREEAAGLVARRTLLPGQPIPKDALRGVPVIRQGQAVSARYDHGAISIVLNGTAVEPGGVGDTISVRNAETGRLVRGRVVDARTVAVLSP